MPDKNKNAMWDKIGGVGKQSKVVETPTEVQPEVQPEVEAKSTRAKNLKTVPTSYFDAHKAAKEAGKTSLNFSDYIVEALREKLEKDEFIK